MKQRKYLMITVARLLAIALMATSAVAAAGQSTDDAAVADEIVVTATKREESLLDVPMSVKALTGLALERQGADQFADYYRTVPSLTFQERSPGFNTITVRGVSSVVSSGGAATTGIYYDDMPVGDSNFQSDIKLVDIERVEVLRGPQGTLYGEGSMGGTVRVITRKPDLDRFGAELGGRLATTEDGDMSWGLEGVINMPLVQDRAGVRIVAYKRELGGWIDNVARGEADVNEDNTTGARASLKFLASDRMSVTLTALYQDQKVGGAQNTNPALGDTLVQFRRRPEPSRDKFSEFNGTLNYDLGFAELVSSTSYFKRHFEFDRDLQALADVFGAITSSLHPTLTTETFTEEARLSSKSGGRFRWVAGVFYKDRKAVGDETADLDFVNFYHALSETRLKQVAVFGEADYQITDRFKLTGGLRAFRETQRIHSELVFFTPQPDFEGKQTASGLNPKFAADYKLDDDRLLYAVASKGFRSGGVNQSTTKPTFDPDQLWSYELGLKGYLFDRRVTFNVAAFYIDWQDVQISVPDPSLPGLSFIDNAGKAHSTGIEAEFTARPIRGLEIGASLGFNDAVLQELRQGSVVAYEEGRLPNVPKIKSSISIDYSRPVARDVAAFGRLDWSYTGSSVNGVVVAFTTPPMRQKSYELLNLRFGLRADHWELEGFVENLTNEIAQLNIDPGLSSPGNPIISVNRPRTIGVALKARF